MHEGGDLPLDDVCAALLDGKQLKPNTSTVVAAVAPTQLLHALDTKTAALIDHIIAYQDATGPVGSAMLPNCSRRHVCDAVVPAAALRKLRRTFLKSIQLNPPAPKVTLAPTPCLPHPFHLYHIQCSRTQDVCDLMMEYIMTQQGAGLL